MIHPSAVIGDRVTIKEGNIIGKNVIIGDDSYLDYNCIVRDNVHIGKGSFIGAGSILGEYLFDFYKDHMNKEHILVIGEKAIIRTGSVIYGDVVIGDNFQTGHKVIIRENTLIGNNVSIGTQSDIQHHVIIGNYVRIHSNCFICEKSIIHDYVWIFPKVIMTNDLHPPSDDLAGVTIHSFAIIAAQSLILPGITVNRGAIVGGGATVTKNVEEGVIVVGSPAKPVGLVKDLKNKNTGDPSYPWEIRFSRGMPWEEIGYDKWVDLTGKGKGGEYNV